MYYVYVLTHGYIKKQQDNKGSDFPILNSLRQHEIYVWSLFFLTMQQKWFVV